MLSGFIQAGNLEIDLQQVMDIETASCVPAVGELHCQMVPLHAYKVDHNLCLSLLGWNERDCINGQKTTPRIRRWNDHAGSQKSTPWSRHPASKNGAQQRCQGLFPFSQDALEDEIETDSCKSRSPTVSSPLPKHSSSIVGAVQQNPKFTSCRATNSSSKVRTKFLAFHIQNDLTQNLCKNVNLASILLAIWFVAMLAIMWMLVLCRTFVSKCLKQCTKEMLLQFHHSCCNIDSALTLQIRWAS